MATRPVLLIEDHADTRHMVEEFRPVIVLSAIHDCENEARRLGAVAVIPKPIDLDRVIAVVRTHSNIAAE